MNWAKILPYRLGLKKFNEAQIKIFTEKKDLVLLRYVLRRGNYKNQIFAIHGVLELNATDALDDLYNLAKSDFEVVAREAILAIQTLDVDQQYSKEIKRLNTFWNSRKEKSYGTGQQSAWQTTRPKMKNLERLRKQLKKPSNTGKWL